MNHHQHLSVWLEKAAEKQAHEILFHPSEPVRYRIGKELQSFQSSQLSPAETRQIVTGLLTDDEKKQLFENLAVEGVRTLGSVNFRFNFQIDFDGISGSLELQKAMTAAVWGFPQVLPEVLTKVEGLHLINGPRRSGKSTAVSEILQSLASQTGRRKKVIAVYTDNEAQNYHCKDNVVSVFPVNQLARYGVLRAADLVILDTDRLDFCEMALRLAESGRSVMMTTSFWHLGMGIERFIDLCDGDRETKLRRFSRVFQSGLGLRLMPGIETVLQGAFEMLLGTQEIKETLRLGQMEALPEKMKENADKTGMRTLNQALFQLLLKRKIELKTAFENSSEPQELDNLLRKVGI